MLVALQAHASLLLIHAGTWQPCVALLPCCHHTLPFGPPPHHPPPQSLVYAAAAAFLVRIIEPLHGARELIKYLAATIILTSFATVRPLRQTHAAGTAS